MTEQGEVYKIDKKNRAIVRFPRTTACKNCNMCFKPRNEMFVEVTLENTLNAKVGDSVVVSMGKKAVLGASVIVYLVPIVLVGAILALTYQIDETLSFVFATIGLVVAETLIAVTDRLLRKKTEYMPKMVEILGRAAENGIPVTSESLAESDAEQNDSALSVRHGDKELDESDSELSMHAQAKRSEEEQEQGKTGNDPDTDIGGLI